MKRLLLLAMLALGVSTWAATIQFDPAPVPLKGTFRVRVAGIQAATGDVVVVNVNTGELVRVPLKPGDGRLVSEEIYALRDCDQIPPEAQYVLHVAVGDVLAAATELEDGLSTTALVAAPQGRPELSLRAWDGTRNMWCPRQGGHELSPGRLLVTVVDPVVDVGCERESVPLALALGDHGTQLDLREEGPAAGRFSAEMELVMEPLGTEVAVKLLHQGSELLSVTARAGLALVLTYGELVVSFPLASLEAALELEPGAMEDVGCQFLIKVAGVEASEVRWFVDGIEQAERGPELRVVRSEPTYPDEIQVIALVRQGDLWDRVQTSVSFVPRTEISFVDAETGEPVSGWTVCTRPIAVKLTQVYDDPTPRVWFGLLGPGCSAQEISLTPQGEGDYLSQAIIPQELGACAGDVLWAQYKDPTCPEDVAYVLLVLR